MQLKFYAKCGEKNHPPPVVHWPGLKKSGQMYQYVGRKFDTTTRIHRALPDPVAVDSASVDGRRLAEICRRDYDLWPADKATAEFCGRPFVELSRGDDGEWRPKPAAPVKAPGKAEV